MSLPDIYIGPNSRVAVATGDPNEPYREVRTERQGVRLHEQNPGLRAELLRQGGVECIERKFFAAPGVNGITINHEGTAHRREVHGAERDVETDCPGCNAILLRDCVDNPTAIGAPGSGVRPFPGTNIGDMTRDRQLSGSYQWSLNPASRPYDAEEVEAILNARDRGRYARDEDEALERVRERRRHQEALLGQPR